MKSPLLLFILLLFQAQESFAQNKNITDSLFHIINASKDPKTIASNYILLGKDYFQSDFNKSIQCFDKAIEIGYRNNLTTQIADGYNNKGFALINVGDQSFAHACLDSAMMYHKKAGNEMGIGSVLGNFGNLYYASGDYPKSLEYELLCLKKREELNDTAGQSQAYNGIANIYLSEQNYDKALTWYQKCLDISRAANDRSVEVSALCNIGIVLIRQNKLDEATKTFNDVVTIATSTNHIYGLANANMGFSKIELRKKKPEDALTYLKEAERLFIESGNLYRINEVTGKIGDIYYSMKQYQKAIEYYNLFYEKALKMGLMKSQINALQMLSETYAVMNNDEMAYKYLNEYTKKNDSLKTTENAKMLREMQTRFETEKKEKENLLLASKLDVQALELNTNRFLMIGLAALLILTVIIGWLIVRQNRLKFEQTSIQLKQKLLRSQMNPHFIFNSLTTIESFIYENQPKEAGKYLSDFARLMRLILENSAEEYIPLNKEIKTLEYYLALQRLRLDDNLTYTITMDTIKDIESINIPPMLTQPFIENAIEHGFKGNVTDAHIDIEFKNLRNDVLQISVTDNGRGINSTMQINPEKSANHKSMAVQITKERLEVLNKSKRQKATFSIHDISESSPQKSGTSVVFTIPFGFVS